MPPIPQSAGAYVIRGLLPSLVPADPPFTSPFRPTAIWREKVTDAPSAQVPAAVTWPFSKLDSGTDWRTIPPAAPCVSATQVVKLLKPRSRPRGTQDESLLDAIRRRLQGHFQARLDVRVGGSRTVDGRHGEARKPVQGDPLDRRNSVPEPGRGRGSQLRSPSALATIAEPPPLHGGSAPFELRRVS
jgi:hypothetical protein